VTHVPAVSAYFDGVLSVMGFDRTGIYGGIYICDQVYSHHRARWMWQTYAWSRGSLHPAANIYQYQNDVTIGGARVDMDKAFGTNFGQWNAQGPSGGGEAPAVPGTWDINGPVDQTATWAHEYGNTLFSVARELRATR
jgi:hypothetical protein